MKYRLLVTDLDDTLLGHDGKVSEGNRESIQAAIAAGVKVCLATGRMLCSALPIARSLGIHNGPIICCQGAVVADVQSGQILSRVGVPRALALEVLGFAEANSIYAHYVSDETYFLREATPESKVYAKMNGGHYGVETGEAFYDRLVFDPQKILLIGSPEKVAALYQEAQAKWGEQLSVVVSRPMFLEFSHKDAHKGFALKNLARLACVSLAQTLAIGDGMNDLTMIQAAGFGVAIGNAVEALKDAAGYVAPPNDEDGVAHVIGRFLLPSETNAL